MNLKSILKILFWFGCVILILGQIISFYPGAEREWFIAAAVLLCRGIFIKSKGYCIASAILVLVAIGFAVSGHQTGIEYKGWLENKAIKGKIQKQ